MMETLDLNQGALAPVTDEVTIAELDVSGQIPTGLDGTLIRSGPNPFDGRFSGGDMLSWWVAPAMVHGVALDNGTARWYRNRWVETGHRKRLSETDRSADRLWDHNPNVNVISHGGRVLALGEGGIPFELDDRLVTVGPTSFGGALSTPAGPTGMTAHPKIDPRTGELVFFRADWQPPYLRYGTLDAAGKHTVDQEVELPVPVMMHDFAITATRAVFLDLNVGYDFSMLQHGAAMPLRWLDEKPARIGVMPRAGGAVSWVDITPCFIQHVVNAHDLDADTVVFEAVRYDRFLDFDADSCTYRHNPLGTLWRYTLRCDSRTGSMTVAEQQLDDRFVELPRIDERLTGRPHRYTYAVEQPTDVEMRGLIKYDVEGGTSQRHAVAPGDQNSEPIFVPRGRADADADGVGDDGWILACVYRRATDTSDVVILDASDLSADPVATIHLPRRIPAGFHGAWIAAN